MTTTEKLRLYRKRFGWLFAISLVFIAISVSLTWSSFPMAAKPIALSPHSITKIPLSKGHPIPPSLPSKAPESSSHLAIFLAVASLLTSATSFAGFFITTVMAWRKDKRESQNADLDLEKKRLELEKLRRELTPEAKTDGRS